MNSNIAKKAVGNAAADFVKSGMLVGLGTGSTASYFIQSLIERCRQGLKIEAVATSERSRQQAIEGGIPFCNIDTITSIDLAVDGADEIDHQKRMIKGGGGALLREKIIASISKEMVVIVDENKLVENLGAFPLPVEIVPFAHQAIIFKINSLGYSGAIRRNQKSEIYITDNGNYIFDIHFQELRDDPEADQQKIQAIPGVVETGFFFNLAGRVLIGRSDGSVKQLTG